MVSKIQPTKPGPRRVLVDNDSVPLAIGINDGPSNAVIPRKSARSTRKRRLEVCFQVYDRVVGRLIQSYKRLPWLTRKTINVAVSLYAVLYTFFTVPLRIAFYYDPYASKGLEETHRWTDALTMFAVLDAVADIIGLVEFVAFYRVWKEAFTHLSTIFSSLRSVKDRHSDTDRLNTARLVARRQSSSGILMGKVNWTISSINPLASMPSDDADDALQQQKYMTARNIELMLELVALAPLELLPYTLGAYNTLHLVRVSKLCRMYRLQRGLKRIAKLYSDRAWVQHLSSTGVDSLARSIAICTGLCHWVACGYMLIAHAQCGVSLEACDVNVETSWVVRDRLFGASVPRKYGRALYWSTRTLVLLGYDDVTPVSNAETIYAVLVTIMGALFGSSLLANFLFLFRFRNARYAAYSAHVDNAREYMRLQDIPRPIKNQVLAYFNYSWYTHRSLDSEEALELLPRHLQAKVIAALRANRLAQVCFLMKESVEFINELALALVRRVCSPGDQVIEPKANAQMFFVISGQVVLSLFNGANPHEYQTGDFFAESCLLFPEVYSQMAIAKTFCELYVLTKAKFDDVLSEFYPGSEKEVRLRMTGMLDRYSMQLRKTKKILGLRESFEHFSGRTSAGRASVGRSSVGRSRSTQGRNSIVQTTSAGRSSVGRSSVGRSTRSLKAGGSTITTRLREDRNWRLPGSTFRVLWDTVRLVAIIYVGFEVTYFAVFISMTEGRHMFTASPDTGGARYWVTLLVEIFFGIDLVLRSRYFAFLDFNVMISVVRPDLIFTAYRSHGFFLDLLAWLPVGIVLDLLSYPAVQVYSSLFRLIRLLRLRLVPYLLDDLCDVYGTSSKFQIVLGLVLGVTLMLHIVGCLWFEMGMIPPDSKADHEVVQSLGRSDCLAHATQFHNCSWVKFDCYAHVGTVFPQDDSASTYVSSFAYLRSVYWAIVTLTAVGYGDIVAFSTSESYFAALWIFVGGIINFGVMGAMSSTISNLTATSRHHMERVNTINSTLERASVSNGLSSEIRHFYHQQYVGHKQAYESQLLSHLPDQLCYHISSLLHSKAVKSVALFDSASIEFVREVTGKFRNKSYQNGETICIEGDVCRELFVFLKGSKVNVFFRSRRVPVRALHAGDCYGANEFLLKRSHPCALIASSLVHASVLSREQFDTIERKFAGDLRDMKTEAHTLLTEEKTTMNRVTTNLARPKLQPHLLQTPSLFYQRDNIYIGSDEELGRSIYTVADAFATSWSAIITSWSVYNAVFVIFRVCFHAHLHFASRVNIAVWVADLSCDVFFALDIYLRLYYFGCSEVGVENLRTRVEIDKQYLRSSTFMWDLLASLPIYTPYASESLIASLCRLPRLVRCVDLWGYLDDVIVQIQQHFATHHVSAYLSPIKLMIVLVLVAHYTGCIFFLISEHECVHTEHCWMAHDHLVHEYHHSVPILYGKSFYWAITTLLLVGSREMVPRNTAGTLWTGFTCLCCTFIIGHIVGEISELILELGKETKEYKRRIASFESFANEHDLADILRERVEFYFREEFERTKGTDLCATVQDLSANLRLQLMLEVYGYSIESLPIVKFLTASQINNLALRLQPELFIPGDNILVEGTFGSRLCTLRKGAAAAYWTKSVATVSVLTEGAFFGEIAFFLPNQRRLATVRATTSCEVLSVSKKDWQELWIPSDDVADSNVQKRAQYAILNWVNTRLQRYQRATLHTASRAKNTLAARAHRRNLKPLTKEKSTRRASKLFFMREKSTASSADTQSPHALLWAPTPPRKMSKAEICRLFVSPTIQLLEKKAEYLLAKSTVLAAKTPSDSERRRNVRPQDAPKTRNFQATAKRWCCFGASVADRSSSSNSTKADDLLQRQFIVDVNPVNDYLGNCLRDDDIRWLETESWARFKLLTALQHVVSKLLGDLIPVDAGTFGGVSAQQSSPVKIQVRRNNTPKPLRPFRFDDRARRKWSAAIMQMASSVSRRKTIGPNAAVGAPEAATPRPSFKFNPVRRRSFPAIVRQVQDLFRAGNTPKPKPGAPRPRLFRSNSLPHFDDSFFRDTRHYKKYYVLATDDRKGQSGIDFEILQRCQRPQYATQLQWYHRYRRWKEDWQDYIIPAFKRLFGLASDNRGLRKVRGQVSPLSEDIRLSNQRGNSDPRSAVVNTAQLHIPNQQALRDAITDFESKHFITRIKQLGKAWSLLMLVISAYHLTVTPFKICFSHELSELPTETLRIWSGCEIFLDALCLVDVIYKLHIFSPANTHRNSSSVGSLLGGGLWQAFRLNSELWVDILAMVPLELLLFSTEVRVPVFYVPGQINEASAAWWTTRWLLRTNRMLLISRLQSLSEQLFQYVVHDLKLPVSEALLYFLRALASYLAMGHLLACIWFVTSELGLWHYGVSWMSTSGMLTFIPTSISADDLGESARFLSEASTGFSLEHVALARKYWRSLLFSLECISTLFYGDILSMNPLELVAEIAITFWSIYIYGALVGAQGEWLDSKARQEAAFEQSLAEIQHFLLQNDVPIGLRRQIKAYYARTWKRHQGKSEFASVENVSRALYEDVVFATQREFAAQVRVFRVLDENFLRGLLVCLEYVVCSEGEEIVSKGDMDRSMYFIAQGRVMVRLESGESIRERGEFFGEFALLYGISRLETCMALSVVELYRLDHEPYEKLLQDFPGYRRRNKQSWTSPPPIIRSVLQAKNFAAPQPSAASAVARMAPTLARRLSVRKLDVITTQNIENELPHSFVYKSTMEMLSQMHAMHPDEVKNVILKCRAGSRKRISRELIGSQTAEGDEDNRDR